MAKLAGMWLCCLLALPAHGQTIEGYWQDTARRILFSREAPADYVYGRWGDQGIEFTRTSTWPGCSVRHKCDLEGANQLLCALETRCPKAGADELVWRGEERYARRESCERVDKRQAQGIPHRCR